MTFFLALRQFRQQRPWLRETLSGGDRFDRISDDHSTLFYGHRIQPNPADDHSAQEVVMLAHMGGDPITVTPGDWLQLDLGQWQGALASPGLTPKHLTAFEMSDGQGILLEPQATA